MLYFVYRVQDNKVIYSKCFVLCVCHVVLLLYRVCFVAASQSFHPVSPSVSASDLRPET